MKATGENKVRDFLKGALDNAESPFIKACEKAGIPPTRRQASKWLSKRGLAYKFGR